MVGGIGGYGNCVGVPTVAGEVMFDAAYNANILVNAFCLGLVRKGEMMSAKARGVGNPVLYVGSATGRDGIHGASMASAEFDKESEAKRPAVQVGDPFTEKLLIEACLEAGKTGAIVAIQDMGAAGLTSSSSEMPSHGGLGIEIDLDQVPLREANLTPYEILLSESQERMLIVAERGREAELQAVFEKWDLHAVVIGRITDDQRWRARWHGQVVADIPIGALADDAPLYDRPAAPPKTVPPEQSGRRRKASGAGEGAARAARQSQCRVEEVGLSAIRLDRAEQHGAGAGQRRGGAANQEFAARDGAEGRFESARVRARSVSRRGRRGLRGGAQCRVRGRAAGGNHELPELRQSGEARGHVAVYPRRRRAARCVARVRRAGGQRQRELLQRDRRPCDSADADDRGAGRDDRRGQARYAIFQESRRRDRDRAHRQRRRWRRANMCAIFGIDGGQLGAIDLKREAALVDGLVEGAEQGLIRSAHDIAEGGLAVALAEACFNPRAILGAEVELGRAGSACAVDFFGEGASTVILSIAP